MIARHRLTVNATCPIDGTLDRYSVTVEAERVVFVESILEAVARHTREPTTQEELTVRLARELGARVVSVGCHSGVETEVIAP